jgi:hypothetical protein
MPGIGTIWAQQERERTDGPVLRAMRLNARLMEELRISQVENAILRDRCRVLEQIADSQGQLLDEAEPAGR